MKNSSSNLTVTIKEKKMYFSQDLVDVLFLDNPGTEILLFSFRDEVRKESNKKIHTIITSIFRGDDDKFSIWEDLKTKPVLSDDNGLYIEVPEVFIKYIHKNIDKSNTYKVIFLNKKIKELEEFYLFNGATTNDEDDIVPVMTMVHKNYNKDTYGGGFETAAPVSKKETISINL